MYIDKISAGTGVYDICALSAQSAGSAISAETVTSFANVTPYEYEAPDKTHKGLQFNNEGFVGYVEIGSTGNLTLEAVGNPEDTATSPGNANIEATKQIKLKPTTKIQLDSSRRIVSKSKNEVNVEAIFNDFADYQAAVEIDPSLRSAAQKELIERYSGKTGVDEEWAQAYIYGRSWDITCMEHGGVAVQPAGADSDDHINKVKFEHSMKVSVEHFGEYKIAPASTKIVYDYPEGEWVCLCEVLLNNAVQLIDAEGTKCKILSGDNTKWNNAMKSLGGDLYGLDFKGVQLAVGYGDSGSTEIINAGANETVMEAPITGKYIFVKRIALTGSELSGISSVSVLNLSADTDQEKTKFTETDAEGAFEIIAEAEGTPREVTTEINITKDEVTYPVSDGTFTIESINYVIDTENNVVYPLSDPKKLYPIVDEKFEITPCYPVHFNTQGGKGIEWGTFNPLHTSIYSADYRFKENAPVYAVTRPVFEIGAKKNDYHTYGDDFKDLVDEAKEATWGEIVNVARDYADGNMGQESIADERIVLNGKNLEFSMSGADNNLKIISEKNINLNATAKARICAAALDVDYELSTNEENTTEIEGADTNFTYTFKNGISSADTAFATNSAITVSEEFAGVVTKTSVEPTLSKKGKLQREYTLSVPVRDVILGVEKIKELMEKVADLETRVKALEGEEPESGSTAD